jgi:mRNA-degrading endonuclease RelE of RelBE toxin-antitoxin system
MRYPVVWAKSARDELAELWLSSSDRKAISDAANEIDLELQQDAPTKGVELREGLRAFFAPPIRVLFSVQDTDRLVEVLRVRHVSASAVSLPQGRRLGRPDLGVRMARHHGYFGTAPLANSASHSSSSGQSTAHVPKSAMC